MGTFIWKTAKFSPIGLLFKGWSINRYNNNKSSYGKEVLQFICIYYDDDQGILKIGLN